MKKSGAIAVVWLVLVIVALVVWMTGAFAFFPSDSEVAGAFSGRHPDTTVLKVTRVGGDEDEFCFLIDYRMRQTGEIRRARWSVYTSGVHYGWRLDSETLENPAARGE